MGLRVSCEVVREGGEAGLPGTVTVTCGRCSHSETSKGQSDASVRRCMALLRENCPEGESNFYIDEDEEE